MSYSLRDAVLERQDCVQRAIEQNDDVQLYRLADLFKGEGEDEIAEYLLQKARIAASNNWAYDEAKDNSL